MREFTSAEIELCKKIAEKERREIKWGDWIYYESEFGSGNVWFVNDTEGNKLSCENKDSEIFVFPKDAVLLWQEHDCLEWLLERGFYIERLGQDDGYSWSLEIYELDDLGIIKKIKRAFGGESKLEPCQRAVLATMEEKSE